MQLHLTNQPSKRGLANLKPDLMIDIQYEVAKYPSYDPDTNPDGVIDIASSKNGLMDDFLENYCSKHFKFEASNTLRYGETAGSAALVKAVAGFVNENFCPAAPVLPSEIIVTNGVSSLLDILPFNIADDGEAIMYTTPIYGMFNHDIVSRNGLKIVEIPTEDMADQFLAQNAGDLIQAFESKYLESMKAGIRIKAIIICNPCNPLGRCYSRISLVEMARFCAKYKLHLISDEIYAMSAHAMDMQEDTGKEFDTFTSVLTLDVKDGADPQSIHTLYGVSKDFGMGGLRLGFLITRNALVWQCVRKLCMFTWITKLADVFFTKFLEDRSNLSQYLSLYRRRLAQSYLRTAHLLQKYNIPFAKANAGMFIWVDLSSWLSNFEVPYENTSVGKEMRLTIWLLKQGIYLEPGQAFFSKLPGYFRLVYTSNETEVQTAIKRLGEALQRLDRLEIKTY